MPQAPEELRIEWGHYEEPDEILGDAQSRAHRYLESRGFTLSEFTWISPSIKNASFEMNEKDKSALRYLNLEWDYGGLEDENPDQRKSSTTKRKLREIISKTLALYLHDGQGAIACIDVESCGRDLKSHIFNVGLVVYANSSQEDPVQGARVIFSEDFVFVDDPQRFRLTSESSDEQVMLAGFDLCTWKEHFLGHGAWKHFPLLLEKWERGGRLSVQQEWQRLAERLQLLSIQFSHWHWVSDNPAFDWGVLAAQLTVHLTPSCVDILLEPPRSGICMPFLPRYTLTNLELPLRFETLPHFSSPRVQGTGVKAFFTFLRGGNFRYHCVQDIGDAGSLMDDDWDYLNCANSVVPATHWGSDDAKNQILQFLLLQILRSLKPKLFVRPILPHHSLRDLISEFLEQKDLLLSLSPVSCFDSQLSLNESFFSID